MSRDDLGFIWIIEVLKNPAVTGFMRRSWTLRDFDLVEAAGVEPIFPTVFESITYESVSAR